MCVYIDVFVTVSNFANLPSTEHTRVVMVVSYMCTAPDIMIATACNFLVLWHTVLGRESVGEWP